MSNTQEPIGSLLSRAEAANYLSQKFRCPISYKTLGRMAVDGSGPRFRKSSRFAVYEITELDAWALSRLSEQVRSTSELGQKFQGKLQRA